MDEFLTKADAARLLDLTPAAVVAMERRGLLPAIRTAGGVRLFERRDIERLAEERAKESSRQGREPAPSM